MKTCINEKGERSRRGGMAKWDEMGDASASTYGRAYWSMAPLTASFP